MCRAVAEIEPRTNIARVVGLPVARSVPVGIAAEIFALAVDGYVVEPELASMVILFHHVEHTEVVELGAISLVPRA